jgi:hypothetical protein
MAEGMDVNFEAAVFPAEIYWKGPEGVLHSMFDYVSLTQSQMV